MIESIFILIGTFIFNVLFVEILKQFKSYTFSTIYFLLHFITNVVIIILTIPYALKLINDPLNFEIEYENYNYISYCYIIIISLHFVHLLYHNNSILWDEKIHHYLTIIFWFMCCYINHPLYSVFLINTCGFPGGITYLMLFLKNLNYISLQTEKKISMELNIWIRSPLSIMFSTLMYCDMIYSEYTKGQIFCIYFIIGFNIYNGIHFMENIIKSYYTHNKN
jgi:hypothetical protein